MRGQGTPHPPLNPLYFWGFAIIVYWAEHMNLSNHPRSSWGFTIYLVRERARATSTPNQSPEGLGVHYYYHQFAKYRLLVNGWPLLVKKYLCIFPPETPPHVGCDIPEGGVHHHISKSSQIYKIAWALAASTKQLHVAGSFCHDNVSRSSD